MSRLDTDLMLDLEPLKSAGTDYETFTQKQRNVFHNLLWFIQRTIYFLRDSQVCPISDAVGHRSPTAPLIGYEFVI